ncbi:MAG: glycosyltransferase family 1 protein [Acidobacteria bacterium]|nr:MAG: glycosyltransferase family 1 protein [Acidobacteriota bacterium]
MRLKILFVIDGLVSGGAERSLAQMLPYLERAGIRSTVAFFYQRADSLEGQLRAQGADLRHLPQRGVLRRVAALRRLIVSEQPDVIHTTLFESNVIGRLASIGLNKVVISSLVNTPYDPIRLQNQDINAAKFWAARLIDTWTARHLTTCFHAITEAVKNAAVDTQRLPPQRITVIERGRDSRSGRPSEDVRRQARLKFGLSEADEVIVTVGRQEYQKGQRYLLEAMAEVARRRPRAVLLIAGRRGRQSPLLDEMQKRIGLTRQIRMLGYREDVPDLLAAADLFVFPSLYEGLGGALLEAMAFELPIVASRIPAIECVVEEQRNALLVERASVAPLAQAMTDLLADRDRARAFGRRSREIFEERFTLDRCATRMVEFYRRLVSGHNGPIATLATSE